MELLERVREEQRARAALPEPEEARRIRKAAGVSQDEVAAHVGRTRGTVSLWEAGITRVPKAVVVRYVELLDELRAAVEGNAPQGARIAQTDPLALQVTGTSSNSGTDEP